MYIMSALSIFITHNVMLHCFSYGIRVYTMWFTMLSLCLLHTGYKERHRRNTWFPNLGVGTPKGAARPSMREPLRQIYEEEEEKNLIKMGIKNLHKIPAITSKISKLLELITSCSAWGRGMFII